MKRVKCSTCTFEQDVPLYQVTQARDDGELIDPSDLLRYMAELKRRALAPIREWMQR